eukprot:TRINITY_DN3347_c0_g1_i1.p1 TRINITY_DN3347_c0_g1~~TRINITY_DN3347_c0_g1_i1.p1  ORF type:complete len:284 (+),score=74.72 TRINITY_DN3347_c0_g1_i1:74-925(+)
MLCVALTAAILAGSRGGRKGRWVGETEAATRLAEQAKRQWPQRQLPECDDDGDVTISQSAVFAEQSRANWTRLTHICCSHDRRTDADQRRALYKTRYEHYSLLAHLSRKVGERGGGLLVEVGTRDGASAVALGNDPRNTLYSFDVANSRDRIKTTMRSRLPRGTPVHLQVSAPNVHFVQTNLTGNRKGHAAWRRIVASANVVLLDTLHKPEGVPFEYGFVQMLRSRGFGGLLLLDDILLNPEMRRFWAWVQRSFGESAVDGSHIGHHSGTGIVNFCGRVTITK